MLRRGLQALTVVLALGCGAAHAGFEKLVETPTVPLPMVHAELSPPMIKAEQSAVRVLLQQNGSFGGPDWIGSATGVVIAPGKVLVSRDLLNRNLVTLETGPAGRGTAAPFNPLVTRSFTIVPAKAVEGAAPVKATLVREWEAEGVLLLDAPGLKLAPAVIATGVPKAGQPAQTLSFIFISPGAKDGADPADLLKPVIPSLGVGFVRNISGDGAMVHSASVPAADSRQLVLDACGRVLGLNHEILPEKDKLGRSDGRAITSAALDALLKSAGVAVTADATPCGKPLFQRLQPLSDAALFQAFTESEADGAKIWDWQKQERQRNQMSWTVGVVAAGVVALLALAVWMAVKLGKDQEQAAIAPTDIGERATPDPTFYFVMVVGVLVVAGAAVGTWIYLGKSVQRPYVVELSPPYSSVQCIVDRQLGVGAAPPVGFPVDTGRGCIDGDRVIEPTEGGFVEMTFDDATRTVTRYELAYDLRRLRRSDYPLDEAAYAQASRKHREVTLRCPSGTTLAQLAPVSARAKAVRTAAEPFLVKAPERVVEWTCPYSRPPGL